MGLTSMSLQLNWSDGSSKAQERMGPHFPMQCVTLCVTDERLVLLRQKSSKEGSLPDISSERTRIKDVFPSRKIHNVDT